MTAGSEFALPGMLAGLERLVACESFSADHAALARSADEVADLGRDMLGTAPERILIGGVSHLRWSSGAPRVLLVGHHDTVWPTGSLREHPWSVADGVARGPGVLDMKAGLVQMFHALASLPSLDGVCVVVNGDEEIGSPTSRALIEESARTCSAAFVLEPAADEHGTLKTARKGVSRYDIVVRGRAAHAGLEPERGVNAAIEAAHQALAAAGLTTPGPGGPAAGRVTVTPTLVSAGTTANTVPAAARVSLDVRAPSTAAQLRVDGLIRALSPRLGGATLEIRGGVRRPPLEPSSSRALFALATEAAAELGQEPPRSAAVGGASDGNFTAGAGCPTLDGLGAVGGGAHADTEYVDVSRMAPRARLLARLVARTLAATDPRPRDPRSNP